MFSWEGAVGHQVLGAARHLPPRGAKGRTMCFWKAICNFHSMALFLKAAYFQQVVTNKATCIFVLMSDTGWVLGVFIQIEKAQWMDDPALCLRACSRLWMSDWEYSHSAEVWSSVCRHNRARNTFWRMVEFTSIRPLMPFLLGLKWFLTFPSLTVLWLLFCADEEVSRKHIEHVIYYTYVQPTAGKWLGLYRTGLVLNGNMTASLCLLSLTPICLEKEENTLIWNLFSLCPLPFPSHSNPWRRLPTTAIQCNW